MASATVLYTPDILSLATGLAAYRLDDTLTDRADARSRSCGSTLTLGWEVDAAGHVARVGLRSQACAIGQASAAIFAKAATGRSLAEIATSAEAVSRWVADEGPLPDWPDFALLAPARDYPARHGALLLPWTAVAQLLSTSARES